MKKITPKARALQLIKRHGSVRAAASAIDVDHVYLFRISTGERADPGDDVLQKLGLRRVVTYVTARA